MKSNLQNCNSIRNAIIYKFVCLFMIAGLWTSVAFGQPAAEDYTFSTSTGNSLNGMSSSTQLLGNGIDNTPSSNQNIGFTFNYEGIPYTTYSVTPDGFLKFGAVTSAQPTNDMESTTNIPKLCPWWDDINTGNILGNVTTVITGSSPNRIRIIQWYVRIPRNTGSFQTSTATFQTWLYETTNVIEFRYGSSSNTPTGGATIGIRGATASPASYISVNTSTHSFSTTTANNSNNAWPGSGRMYRFSPTLPSYKAEFISMNFGSTNWVQGTNRSVDVVVKNVGSQPWTASSPAINIGVKWNTNGTSWADYHVRVSAAGLAPGATATYNFSLTASNNTGVYTTPLAIGTNNITFDVVNEGACWFANNSGVCGPGNSVFTSPNINIILPPCTGTPTPGNTLSTLSTVCNGNSFTLSLQNATSGTGVSYQWQSANDIAFTSGLTNLGTASTEVETQSTSKYYRCLVTCSTGPNSAYSNPVLVSMVTNPCTQCTYCTASATNTATNNEKIASVSLNTLTQTSTSFTGYENFTGLGGNSTTTVFKGDTYPLSVSLTNPYSADQVIVFIDYNQDGDFIDSGETVYTSAISAGPYSTTITIPNNGNVLTGVTRMRVRLHDTGNGTVNATSCGTSTYGQVEDYCITINPPCTPAGNPTVYGIGSWIGYGYQSFTAGAFSAYRGFVTESEIFDRDFGGGALTGATQNLCSAPVDLFTVRYRMTKNFPAGGYSFTVGSDDGVRLSLDGGATWVINQWIDQGYTTYSTGMITLNGNTNVVLEYYENGGGARVSFNYTYVAPCAGTPAPGNTLSSAPNPVCHNATFILSLQNPLVLPGITYQWQSASSATGPWGNIASATANSLTTSTNTTIFYRCAVTCNAGGTGFSNPVQVNGEICFCTPALAGGCITDNEAITNVTFSNINNNSGCSGTGYTNYASTVACAQVNQGQVVPFSLTYADDTYPENVYVWIDYNNNGLFTDAGELEFTGVIPAGSSSISGNIIIPGCTTPGVHRMRVRLEFNPITDPCIAVGAGTLGGGETEDYCIFVNSVPAVAPVPRNITGVTTSPCNSGAVLSLLSGYSGGTQWETAPALAGPYTEIAGATGSSVTLNVNTLGTYYIRVRFTGAGCTPVLYSNVHTITFTAGVVSITSSTGSNNLCRGVPVTLTASGTGPFSWNTGATTSSITVTPLLQVSTYSVSTNNGGCVATASVNYNVSGPLYQATAPASVCQDGIANLNGNLLQYIPPAPYLMNNIPFTAVTCPSNAGPTADDQVLAANIGFPFTYFGVTYTNLGISSNGNIQLGNGSGSANNPAYSISDTPDNLPNTAVPNNTIALAWGDWRPNAGGNIRYGVSGSVGSRIFTVCYNGVFAPGTVLFGFPLGGSLTGQIRLYEGSNRIELHIDELVNNLSAGSPRVAGIENATGTIGFMPAGYSLGNWTAANIGWSFIPQLPVAYNTNGPVTFSWTGSNGFSSNTLASSNVVSSPTTYTLQVSDNTCSSSSQVVVNNFPAVNVSTFNGGPYCEGSDIQFFTSGTGITGPAQAGSLTVRVSSSGLMDEISWQIRNSSNVVIASVAAGTYGFASTYSTVVTPAVSDYPVSFFISTDGVEDDNAADYRISCSLGGSVLVDEPIIGGTTETHNSILCSSPAFTLGYSWTGPNSFTSTQASPVISGASPVNAGAYTVTIIDGNGCQDTHTDNVVINANPVVDYVSVTDETCPGANDGLIEIGISSGDGSYTTTDGGSLTSFDSPAFFFGVGPGTYPFTITDGFNCSTTTSAVVGTQPNLPPTLTCPADVITNTDAGVCGAVVIYEPIADDACPGIGSVIQTAGLPSGSVFPLGSTVNSFTVTDALGLTATCSFTVTVSDIEAPNALCNNITVQLDASGNAAVTTAQIDNGSNDACGVQSVSIPPTSFTCANIGANTVVLTVTDVNGNVSTCNSTVTVEDNVDPVALCQSITVQLDASGNASITAAQIDNGSNDACGIQSMTVSPSSFTCANVGANTVTLTVTDNNGNVSTCTATVTVQDNVAPVATCQNLTIQLDASGVASITAAQIDNGSNDACGIQSMTLSQTNFNCAHVGANTVTLTVTDNNGNVSTCTATVTVQDNVAPVALCQSITVQLDASGNASITASQIDNGSNDACGIQSMTLSQTNFTCANVGANTVTLTVTDNNGNVSTCTATVTVQDMVAPVALCQSITVQLDASGNASIVASQIDNGSNDACGIQSISVSPSSFTCANVGANTVTLTVTDNNGNVSTCTATVTVQDNVAPVALCQSITVQLDASGNASITASQIDNGSSDACGLQSLTVSPNSFTCANVGANTVTLTVTDNNGNVSTCTATVTVQDNVAPVALCQFVTIYLDANGNASTTASAVDNGSNDACGIQSLSLSQTNFDCSHVGNNLVVLTVTDNNGNVSTCNSIVTVVDDILPVITCPSPFNVNNNPGSCGASIIYAVTATDNCPGFTITQIAGLPSGSLFPVGTTVNSFIVIDASGNQTSCSFSVSVTDTESPTITNVPTSFSACNPISWTPPTITDNCPGVQIQSSHAPGTVFPPGTTTVTYTATDVYNHVTTANFNVTVLPPSVAATSITSNRDYNNICLGENITLTLNGGSLGAGATWNWYRGSCGGIFVGTGTSITVNPTSTTTYFVRAEGTCGPSSCTSLQVVVSTGSPTGTVTYNIVPPYGAPGITDVLSVNPVPGATFYQWSTNNGHIGGVLFNNAGSPVQTAIPTVNITFVQSLQNYQIRVLAGNACGRTGQANTHIRGTVGAPTSLTGPTQVCPGQTASYTVSAIPSQSGGSGVSYNWVLNPSNAGTISGTGLTRTITFAAGFTTAQLCVNGISSFGLHGTPLCITISTSAPIPGTIAGNEIPCSASTEIYSIAPVPGATSYIWKLFGNVVVGANGTSASITFPAGTFAGNVCVQSVSSCGTSAPSCLAVVSGAPGTPGPISGPSLGICGASNVNYSLSTSGATYNWILPAGVTPTGPTNLNSINVNFSGTFAGGNIVVQAQYTCGAPVSSSITVSGEPTIPTVNPATICANSSELYFASSTGATDYNWTVNSAIDAFCTNPPSCSQYYMEWGSLGGSFSVTASNGCGTSAPFDLSTNCRIMETGEMDTKVYPNPNHGQFTVEFNSYAGGNHNLTITDLSGRVVMVKDLKATSGQNQFQVDLGFANAGLYMMYVKDSEGKISVTKIVIE